MGHRLTTIILSNLNRFKKIFTGKFFGKFVATLPCETLMSVKQAIKDKSRSSIAAFVRCGGVINNQIKKGLLLSLRVNFFKIGVYL